jgi:hypothetical protein
MALQGRDRRTLLHEPERIAGLCSLFVSWIFWTVSLILLSASLSISFVVVMGRFILPGGEDSHFEEILLRELCG